MELCMDLLGRRQFLEASLGHGPNSLNYVGVGAVGRTQKCVCVLQFFLREHMLLRQELCHHHGFKQTDFTFGVGNCSLFPLLKTVLLLPSMILSAMTCPPPTGFTTKPSSSSSPTQLANPSMSISANPAPHHSVMSANESHLLHLLL